jgi:hypothetical protein
LRSVTGPPSRRSRRTRHMTGAILHGPPHVAGDRAYLPYGIGGAVILDVADVHNPREVGRLQLNLSFGSVQGVHTFLPIPERHIGIVNSEAHAERCEPDPGRPYAAVVDLADESHPRVLSFFPEPRPPEGASSTPAATHTSPTRIRACTSCVHGFREA